MICHSKKCHRPRTSGCFKDSEVEQNMATVFIGSNYYAWERAEAQVMAGELRLYCLFGQ